MKQLDKVEKYLEQRMQFTIEINGGVPAAILDKSVTSQLPVRIVANNCALIGTLTHAAIGSDGKCTYVGIITDVDYAPPARKKRRTAKTKKKSKR